MKFYAKVLIIGAGPIGLYFASKCEEAGLDYLVVDGASQIGGQLTKLYPQKEIVDIPGIPSIKAEDYIKLLGTKVNQEKIILNTFIKSITVGEKTVISDGVDDFECEKLVFATGLGSTSPRPMGLEGEDSCKNIIYHVKDFSHFKDKRVAIFGGGDSALDWSKAISQISDNVHLIHRRLEFRGNPETIKDCKNLNIHLPYVPHALKIEENKATEVVIKKVDEEDSFITIPVDYIFVNYGNVPAISKWPFEMTGAFLNVNENYEVAKNIYAIGDVSQHENKTRRIAPGNKEADRVFELIKN